MSRRLWWLALAAALVAGGYALFQQYKIYLPGIISEWRRPIAANQPVTWASGPATRVATARRPPNVILIVADDLGINDISLDGGGVGGGAVKTPNIDALAAQGVNFTTAYAANATCSPSRAALMTGRYPTRYGFEFTAVPAVFAGAVAHSDQGNSPYPIIFHDELSKNVIDYPLQGVPASEITIAQLLKARGYHTLHIGKWHLGEADALAPHARGFDETLGFRSGGSKYLHQNDPASVNAKLPLDPIDRFLWPNLPYAVQFNNGQRFEPDRHMTDYLTDNALAAIEANRNRPFFLYLAYNAPHTPLQATQGDYDALPMIKDHTTRVYGAMIRQMDRRIGDVMTKLKSLGIDDDTLVIFTSDNGAAWYNGIPDLNKPYRGWKATFFEGGIRVPLLMRWPGKIAPATQSTTRASHLDMFATIAAVAGSPMPRDRVMDSNDVLAGIVPGTPPTTATGPLFWRSGEYRAVRDGDWKLQITARPEKAYLFNLAADPHERRNLASRDPARVAQLRAKIAAHNRGMAKPLWPGLIETPVRIDVPLNAPWSRDQAYIYWTN
ncbi:sulfatase-like hydrolase/transferase [Sphingomonas sp. 37zxx]|uniref:sulfatase-like hydrolase/transferase n=1 Tax=Sphingomonas sp. 37zxx TaxID=1550073 RepID=UPI00053BF279|nr:sulfatase-like hydrolase/transferase [Sphingomonas sp. 37zxx]